MFKHWKEIQQARIELASKSEILSDIILDTRVWKPVYALTESKRVMPLSLLKVKENKFECMAEASLIEALPKLESLAELTPSLELKISTHLNVRVQRDMDDDSPHLDYTSIMQPLGQATETSFWRSTKELLDFQILSSTGPLGPVSDFVFELPKWSLRYLLATDNRVQSRSILIDPEWIESQEVKTLNVNLSREILILEAVFDPRRDGLKRYQIDV